MNVFDRQSPTARALWRSHAAHVSHRLEGTLPMKSGLGIGSPPIASDGNPSTLFALLWREASEQKLIGCSMRQVVAVLVCAYQRIAP